jgi:flavin-dependent dehydrogenase
MKSANGVEDVIIIGGGPAGSTAASFLSMKGHRVTLLEKEKFPREHVGESLLPFCYGIFEQLGVLDQMKSCFVRKPGVRFVDIEGKRSTSWCFNHVIHDPSFLSFQVTRSTFDQMLLDNARKKGAVVKEETRVQDCDFDGPDGTVLVTAVGPDGAKQDYQGKFLIDASGRNGLVSTRKGWRKKFEGLDRTAFWTHYRGVNLLGGLEEGLSMIVYLGGEKKGWIWIFPLDTDRLTVGVVVNNEYIRQQKAIFQQNGAGDWTAALFQHELALSPFVQKILDGSEIIEPLRVEGDYSYYVDPENKYGQNFALVGDASTFIDPIFSSGIFLSMNGSRLVSEAIHQKLSAGEDQGREALVAAYGKINGAYGLVHRLIRLFYNPHAVTFAEAGLLGNSEHRQHENAMAAGHFLLAGDFFDRHEQYHEFMDLLEQPSLFNSYKYNVIDRDRFQASSCGVSPSDVFPSLAPMTNPLDPTSDFSPRDELL